MIGLTTQRFYSKNENALDNVQNSERDLVIDILKKRISDLEIELQRKNLVIDYLHFQLSLKATDIPLSSSATRKLNGTSNQDFVGDKLTETFHSNAATISKHKNPTINPTTTTTQQQLDQTENLGRRRFDVEQYPRKRAPKTAHCKMEKFLRRDN